MPPQTRAQLQAAVRRLTAKVEAVSRDLRTVSARERQQWRAAYHDLELQNKELHLCNAMLTVDLVRCRCRLAEKGGEDGMPGKHGYPPRGKKGGKKDR